MANTTFQILIVEDESVVALDICERLRDLHFGVAGWVSTGEEAVRLATEKRPDLVLMDIKLGYNVSGIEAAADIQKLLNIPVVYLTAYSDEGTLRKVNPTEPYGYVLKPFKDEELRVAIEIALYKHGRVSARERFNKALMETLHDQAVRDSLTGLYNRRYMDEFFRQQLQRAARLGQKMGLIMLDVDHFKSFNDQYGHAAGDAVLQELGPLLQEELRGGDLACRYGGDEFLIILPDSSVQQALYVAGRLQTRVRHMSVVHGVQLPVSVTLSLGVVVFPDHGTTAEALLAKADAALYRAKAEGRDQAVAGVARRVVRMRSAGSTSGTDDLS